MNFLIQGLFAKLTQWVQKPQTEITLQVVEMKSELEKSRANTKLTLMINFITISAPSGSGKTTLCKALQLVEPEIECLFLRLLGKRDLLRKWLDYFFISEEEFEELIIQGHFVEWQNVHGFYYGTSVSNLENAIENDKIMLIEMD